MVILPLTQGVNILSIHFQTFWTPCACKVDGLGHAVDTNGAAHLFSTERTTNCCCRGRGYAAQHHVSGPRDSGRSAYRPRSFPTSERARPGTWAPVPVSCSWFRSGGLRWAVATLSRRSTAPGNTGKHKQNIRKSNIQRYTGRWFLWLLYILYLCYNRKWL